MFTGLIEETGRIKRITGRGGDREIEIQCHKILNGLNVGDSVSVNGVCLTIKSMGSTIFTCDISFSTLNTSTFKYCNSGDLVNLESSLTPADKLGGHLVSGHVDCMSKVLKISSIGKSYLFDFSLPDEIYEFVAPKGSIAIDGISLTISEVKNDIFSSVIIPYTYKNTNMRYRKPQDMVNIEVDMVSRYIVNYLQHRQMEMDDKDLQKLKDKVLKEKLEKYGFKKRER
jgi:riboflavin synthase